MAKSNKERKELKEKRKEAEKHRKKKKILIAKLAFVGVYVFTIILCMFISAMMSQDLADTAASLTLVFILAVPCFLIMMFGTTKYPYRGSMETTWSFSEFGICFFACCIIANFLIVFI